LTWKIKQLQPYAFFLLNGKKKSEWEHWAGNLACDILHAFNNSQFLIKDEKSRRFFYIDGSIPKHETNLLRLNNQMQKEIEKRFNAIDKDENEFNALEQLLNKDTTPPMLCTPLDRPSDNSLLYNFENEEPKQGGYLNNRMQVRFPVISNNITEDVFDIIRLEPSKMSIDALNNLQKTEWAANEKVRPIVEKMLELYIQKNIVDLFQIRTEKRTKKITGKSLFSKSIRKDCLSEIESSEELSINEINNLINSKWDELDEKIKRNWVDKAKSLMEEDIYCLDMKSFPKLTLGQINHWKESFRFINTLEENFAPEHRSFFHAWNLDWRGRMYTCSTILDPQNDDFSRGLITFAKSYPLDENGWLWLKRYTASLLRDRNLSPEIFNDTELDEWKKIQEFLETKSFDNQDKVANNPVFIKILQKIVHNPIATSLTWAEGDIFVAKSEGFQRIAAIIAFVEAYENGGVGALVNLPINQDASSSVYQHASLLVRDKEMAKLVNIIDDGELPADAYREVIDDLAKQWSSNPPFQHLGLPNNVLENLKNSVLKRSIAKKPVMTIGYGATKRNMIKSLLSHNGESSGLLGGWIALWDDKEIKYSEDVPDSVINLVKTKESKWSWRMIAHPSCILSEALNDVEAKFHEEIASVVIGDLLESVNNTLTGFQGLLQTLEEIITPENGRPKLLTRRNNAAIKKIRILEANRPLNDSELSQIDNLKEENKKLKIIMAEQKQNQSPEIKPQNECLKWELADGTIIRNVKLKKVETKSKAAPIGLESNAISIRRNIHEMLDVFTQHSVPIYNMLIPVKWDEIEGINDDDMDELKKSETQRFQTLIEDIKDIDLRPKDFFSFEKRPLLVEENPGATNKEIYLKLNHIWDTLDEDEKVCYDSRVETLDQIISGDSIENWDIDWQIFRFCNGLELNSDPITKVERENLYPKIQKIINRFIGTAPCMFSRRILSGERNIIGEKSGIAPNFVHSHDACHMRLVVSDMGGHGAIDLWSVHDSFGCHPNHIEKLRHSVIEQMKTTHETRNGCEGTLDRLMKDHLENKRIDAKMSTDDINGKYLIY
jgi:hypothetical protein